MAGGLQRGPEGGEAVAAADVIGALHQSNEPHGGSSLWAAAGSRSQALPGTALSCRLRLLFDALRTAGGGANGRAARRSLASVRSQPEPGNEGSRPRSPLTPLAHGALDLTLGVLLLERLALVVRLLAL